MDGGTVRAEGTSFPRWQSRLPSDGKKVCAGRTQTTSHFHGLLLVPGTRVSINGWWGAECKERPWALLKESMRAVSKCRVIRTYLPSGDKVLLDSDGMEVAHGVSLHTGDGVEMIHDMALHSGDGIEIAHGVVHLLNKWK